MGSGASAASLAALASGAALLLLYQLLFQPGRARWPNKAARIAALVEQGCNEVLPAAQRARATCTEVLVPAAQRSLGALLRSVRTRRLAYRSADVPA